MDRTEEKLNPLLVQRHSHTSTFVNIKFTKEKLNSASLTGLHSQFAYMQENIWTTTSMITI